MNNCVISLKKCEKKCNMLYIILVQGFCPLKIKITQFTGGFRLKSFYRKLIQFKKKSALYVLLTCLGYRISKESITPMDDKLDAITNKPPPKECVRAKVASQIFMKFESDFSIKRAASATHCQIVE